MTCSSTSSLAAFKAYDIRGRVPDTLNADLTFALGRSLAEILPSTSVVVGHDARLSGPMLSDALTAGLQAAGAKVTDIGQCGTEEIYYAAANQPFDAGVMITGSHNPADENGFKIVRGGAVPVSGDSGLNEIRDRVAQILGVTPSKAKGDHASFRADYVSWLLSYSGLSGHSNTGPRLKVVADAGNGCARKFSRITHRHACKVHSVII